MKEFKPVILFIVKFFAVYILLTIGYNLYLNAYLPHNISDPFSVNVAECSSFLLNKLGFQSFCLPAKGIPIIWINIDGSFLTYVNEGCNAISVVIIFIAFIIAFSTTWKQTIVYIIIGVILLQICNIGRIILLNYIARYQPDLFKTTHDYLFPASIYGAVLILCAIWIKFFVMKHKNAKLT